MTARPKLLIISFSELKSDARLLKQIAGFAEDYEVTTCGYGISPDERVTHIQLSGEHPIWAYDRFAVMTHQYRKSYWGNPAIQEARELLSGAHFDVILSNDVDPMGIALELKPTYGVHADLHEYSPRQKEDMLRWRLFVAPFIRWMVKTFVAKANSWTTVSGGLSREYERVFGFRADLVTNASPFHEFEVTEVQNPIRLVHSGAALRDRKLEIMVDALELSKANVTLDLFLTPNDASYIAQLRERSARLPALTVHDPVPYQQLIAKLHEYDAGVFVLEPLNFSYQWALPNKLFDFVQARLGMVVGPSPEMVDLVNEYELGAVSDSFSAADLAAQFDALDADTVRGWKQAADRSAQALSSEAQVQKWRSAVAALVAR